MSALSKGVIEDVSKWGSIVLDCLPMASLFLMLVEKQTVAHGLAGHAMNVEG